ncbi:phosphoserine phosphatase SerB [Acidithiobacillus sp. CV18-2]|uniref:Phosphoserine phosphatase n=1 Tax=Igneacidithiobacillus copahuensis TaxID=2724909 RepID=A0AAE2YNK2_9PROT|nr:phosphoserine phosphatase SerB [Igneacidithiobacillus copahuensis]MBU2755810.1 phosphoserine phosphatase SerB [Acidithiobacillus sp. CV18-3]MBU2756275.1 phosphoserine phosphatase SerB [Acidithiobacillus sp. BN09-2]MBU2777782.1 phosphoserine phosphatase SerB [Acidithiobacillus sp. CV18-2]MBU2795966.1 phosphoserine phosphatase SerB [Acidithiobacillus sp. VAN18-2]MBU2800504.1 phosphoserine phosphatase SerB [Acidithiobacillus sp. VAN18-4]UTV80400.1 phosphoserine phosphatase SerB [Acidithiobaci
MSATRLAILSPAHQGRMALPASMSQIVAGEIEQREIAGSWLQSWRLPADFAELQPFLEELARQGLAQEREILWGPASDAEEPLRLVLRGDLRPTMLRRALTSLQLRAFLPGRVLLAQGNELVIEIWGDAAALPLANHQLVEALMEFPVDVALTPNWKSGQFRLLISDMDSTLIAIECIDELGAHLGLKSKIAAITERSMAGELDFRSSLRERVRLLAGTPVGAIDAVIRERLQFSPGARDLVAAAKRAGMETAVVSGGFTQFTRHVQEELDLDYAFANQLDIRDGKLTGEVIGDIVDAEAKADILDLLAIAAGTNANQCVAIGDGANDLPMLRKAGVGIAYRAKPAVRAQANYQIRQGGLEFVSSILGLV